MVTHHYGNYFIISLTFVDHLKTADRDGLHQQTATVYVVRTQHADIQRVVVAHHNVLRTSLLGNSHYFRIAVRSRNKTVKCGNNI